MRLLLDTQAAVWWLTADPRISEAALSAIRAPDADIAVSAASVWELAIKRVLGKYDGVDLHDALAGPAVAEIAITGRHGRHAAGLPLHHRDPFDRVIVAQSILDGRVLVTSDGLLRHYGCATLW